MIPDRNSGEVRGARFGGIVIMGIEGTRGDVIAALLTKRFKLLEGVAGVGVVSV